MASKPFLSSFLEGQFSRVINSCSNNTFATSVSSHVNTRRRQRAPAAGYANLPWYTGGAATAVRVFHPKQVATHGGACVLVSHLLTVSHSVRRALQ